MAEIRMNPIQKESHALCPSSCLLWPIECVPCNATLMMDSDKQNDIESNTSTWVIEQ